MKALSTLSKGSVKPRRNRGPFPSLHQGENRREIRSKTTLVPAIWWIGLRLYPAFGWVALGLDIGTVLLIPIGFPVESTTEKLHQWEPG